MRALITALSLVFALAGFATSVQAGENCSYSGHETKKNDFETPPPAAASVTKPKKQG
jgi:hypothetical protein